MPVQALLVKRQSTKLCSPATVKATRNLWWRASFLKIVTLTLSTQMAGLHSITLHIAEIFNRWTSWKKLELTSTRSQTSSRPHFTSLRLLSTQTSLQACLNQAPTWKPKMNTIALQSILHAGKEVNNVSSFCWEVVETLWLEIIDNGHPSITQVTTAIPRQSTSSSNGKPISTSYHQSGTHRVKQHSLSARIKT
mgnify:FL=1